MTRGSGMDDMPNQCQPKLKRNFNRTPPVADSFVAVEESYHVRIIEQQNLESSDLSKEKQKQVTRVITGHCLLRKYLSRFDFISDYVCQSLSDEYKTSSHTMPLRSI